MGNMFVANVGISVRGLNDRGVNPEVDFAVDAISIDHLQMECFEDKSSNAAQNVFTSPVITSSPVITFCAGSEVNAELVFLLIAPPLLVFLHPPSFSLSAFSSMSSRS
eukprot:GHVU01077682.1.p2 GENE.GHVU01077682.1~~GHVU01077682.1.p2  ORF type:complete len:108 (+),score=7.02 GHVU01077682.1:182-505(+)